MLSWHFCSKRQLPAAATATRTATGNRQRRQAAAGSGRHTATGVENAAHDWTAGLSAKTEQVSGCASIGSNFSLMNVMLVHTKSSSVAPLVPMSCGDVWQPSKRTTCPPQAARQTKWHSNLGPELQHLQGRNCQARTHTIETPVNMRRALAPLTSANATAKANHTITAKMPRKANIRLEAVPLPQSQAQDSVVGIRDWPRVACVR